MAERDIYTREPITERPVEIRRDNTGWWVAALVAIVALVGMFFIFGAQRTSDQELIAARETGRAEAALETATVQAQAAAQSASAAATTATASVARATEDAAQNASAAAQETAQATEDAAVSASDAASEAVSR